MLCAVVFAVCGLIGSSQAQSGAETVPARGAVHEDFGRLVLDWPQQVVASVKGDGRRLVMQFDRPAAIDLKSALGNLKDYVETARLSDGGSTLTIDFTAPVTWRTFSDGSKLALDFGFADDISQQEFPHGPDLATGEIATEPAVEGGDAANTASPGSAPKPVAGSAGPVVPVRAGEHQGFSRLAFDWPKDVPYQMVQSGDQVELRFAGPGRIDASKVAADMPPRVKAIAASTDANGTVVRMQVRPDMVLRDFRSGRTVVLDIYDRNAASIPPQTDRPPALPDAVAQGAPPAVPGSAPLATTDDLAEVAPAVDLPEPLPAPPQTALQSPPEEALPQSEAPTPGDTPGDMPGDMAALDPQLQTAPPEPPREAAPPPAGQPATEQPAAPATAGATGPGVAAPVASSAPAVFEPPKVAPPAANVKITALPLKDSATLYFDWPRPVALAIFRHGDAVWLVFDAPGKGDLRPIQRLAATIGKVETVPSAFAFALRLTGGTAASPTAASEGARWKITLRPGTDMTPSQSIQQRRGTRPDGKVDLLVQAVASGAAADLTDPVDRSRLVVTPGEIAGLGLDKQSDWPDFRLLPSYQGVVVQPLNDRAQIQALPNGVVVTTPAAGGETADAAPKAEAPQPEAATPGDPKLTAMIQPSPATGNANSAAPEVAKPLNFTEGLFDLPKWRRGGETSFLADRQALKDKMDNAAPADRNRARLDFAEFYFANGYGPEAAGLLDLIRHDDRNADGNPLIMALAATARTMGGENAAAERLLDAPALSGVPEANLMRAIIAATKGDGAAAAKLFAGALPDFSEYPKPFRTRIRLLAAQSLIEAGDPLTAQNFLEPIAKDAPDADTAARAAFLDGERLTKLGKKDEALAAWQALQESPVDEIKAKARFAVVSAQLADKKIEPKDAIPQIEALRYLWRGDTFEFDLLYKLGHLYFDTDQPRKGLITLRQAATHFPDHPMAKQAADDMTEAFRKLYLANAADKLSPLTAVALYDEFRELTPSGADGDRMIAALADRLVKVDLLGNAADLLERQVKLRLSGAEKAAAGTRLAAIRLLDDKPDFALKALAESEAPEAAPELQAERRRLQARALFDTGDTLKGIALVRDDASLEGLWLKSDMYWKLREWPSAADALGQLIAAEQVKLAATATLSNAPSNDVAKNPASVLEKAIAQANAAAATDAAANPPAADAANAADPNAPAAAPVGPPMDPVLARLVLNRAVALSLAGDRRGLKELGRSFGAQMKASALVQPFQVLTAPDSGLTESIAAQMKSVDQLGTFVAEYRKILQEKSLSGGTEPNPDTGPLAPMDTPAAAPTPAPQNPAAPAQ